MREQRVPRTRLHMLPSSLVIIVATALFTLGAALVLFWAWRKGFFSNLDAQSRVIFEERDFRLHRAWESPEVQRDRARAHGPLLAPDAGEWGGAS